MSSSFGEFMAAYEADPTATLHGQGANTPSTATAPSPFAGFAFPGNLSALGDSVQAGMRSVGRSSIFAGTSLATVDLEAGDDVDALEQNKPATGEGESWNALSRSERFRGFVLLLSLSMFFFLLAFFFTSVIVVFPAKFAFSFTMGSVCYMSAFALIKGPSAWLKSVCSGPQLPFTLAYFLSIFGTLYACLVMRSYVFVMFFSVVQVCALGYYAFGNLPGGRYGLRLIGSFIKQVIRNVCWPCAKGIVRMFQSMFS
ncbi:Protein transport protein SFT2 [Hondaea fermentalgiana]|uniref:Vesicle transport protein n=1 Tax=Hondaea fermentalgiana TaxID=2315210 RepID=A0A2R5GQ01_9STRA|nr:Protein transport protein SFT2 [Hondaea fermentalgiana]|eukprot:GBG32685.1 Protein transport protein SFT2 [Hondaea fermentalgiana]